MSDIPGLKTWSILQYNTIQYRATLTQFSVAEALLLHLTLESAHFLEPSLLLLHILPEAL